MPSVATKVTTELTQEVKLRPSVRAKLVTEIKAYAALQAQRDEIDKAMGKSRGKVGDILAEADAQTLHIEDVGTGTWVFPTRSTLDQKKLIALGVTTQQIKDATVVKPGKPYVKITPAKEGK